MSMQLKVEFTMSLTGEEFRLLKMATDRKLRSADDCAAAKALGERLAAERANLLGSALAQVKAELKQQEEETDIADGAPKTVRAPRATKAAPPAGTLPFPPAPTSVASTPPAGTVASGTTVGGPPAIPGLGAEPVAAPDASRPGNVL